MCLFFLVYIHLEQYTRSIFYFILLYFGGGAAGLGVYAVNLSSFHEKAVRLAATLTGSRVVVVVVVVVVIHTFSVLSLQLKKLR